MNDYQTLLESIDTPKYPSMLVLADWLEEHGRPEAEGWRWIYHEGKWPLVLGGDNPWDNCWYSGRRISVFGCTDVSWIIAKEFNTRGQCEWYSYPNTLAAIGDLAQAYATVCHENHQPA